MFLFLILFAILLFWNLKIAKAEEFHKDFLSLKVSKGIQGFCALAIIAHHFAQTMVQNQENPELLIIFYDIGYLFVGVFFFFSGYGLFKSYKTKRKYLNGFLGKRLPVVLVPLFLINAIFTIVVLITGNNVYMDGNPLCSGNNSLLFKITTFSCITLMNSNAWYMVTIAVFYIAFYLIFRRRRNENEAFRSMGIFSIIYVVICILLGHGILWFMGEWWYNSSLLLFIGMLCARHEDEIILNIKKNYKLFLVSSLIVTIITTGLAILSLYTISYYRPGILGRIGCLVCCVIQTISSFSFVAFILIFTMKIKLNNSMLDFVGSIAVEVYLVHRMFLQCFKSKYVYIDNNVLYLMLVYIFTILSAIILHKIDNVIVNYIRKKNSENFGMGIPKGL